MSSKSPISSIFKGKKILVVEDNSTHRAQIEKILSNKGIKTIICIDGEDALDKLEFANNLDMIILDWNLPGISGLGVARQIKLKQEAGEMNQVPIIAFTANKAPGDKEQCMEIGMDDYLSKELWLPIWEEKLDIILNKWLLGRNKDPVSSGELKTQKISNVILNKKIFRNAKELMGDQFENIIEKYLTDAKYHIDEISQGIITENHNQVKTHSHPLKSTSMSMGLDKIGILASDIEKDARAALDKGLEPMYPQDHKILLINLYNQGEKAMREALKN